MLTSSHACQGNGIIWMICPTCNVQTNAFPTLASHPVARLYRAVTNTRRTRESEWRRAVFNGTLADFAMANRNVQEAASLSDTVRQRLPAGLNRAFGGGPL